MSEKIESIVQSLADLIGTDPASIRTPILSSTYPERAAINLDRWLAATSNPALQLQQFASVPPALAALCLILGASQTTAESITQNPEFPSLLFEPDIRSLNFDAKVIEQEGQQLLSAAINYSHSLDRVRFLKQKWTFKLNVHDLLGWTPAPVVWNGISAVADACLVLAFRVAWEHHARMRQLDFDCPVLMVAFGKHGGYEINYSSDVDLAFVHLDGLEEKQEREARRFCEAFVHAVTDRMGRGSLYRVDLRLRPFGSAGEISRSMRGYESYYDLYAEPWETQALMRSRALVGPENLMDRWEALRLHRCFRPQISEFTIQEVLSMRDKIDAFAEPEDFKRGPGGIRDIEFTVQALQLLHGWENKAAQHPNTLTALKACADAGFVTAEDADFLHQNYIWLRQLEHRCQLAADKQTHQLPKDEAELDSIAKLVGCQDGLALEAELQNRRAEIRENYRTWFSRRPQASARQFGLTDAEWQTVNSWLQETLGAEGSAGVLGENKDSGQRLATLVQTAPDLVPSLKRSAALTEAIVSGEIEELSVDLGKVGGLWTLPEGATPDDNHPPRRFATKLATVWAQWALNPVPDSTPWVEATGIMDALLGEIARQSPVPLTVLGLGSFGNKEALPASDLDILFLTERAEDQSRAEAYVSSTLAKLTRWKALGANVELDLRLRPEGKKGLMVRTYEGLSAYAAADMELWEAFALGHARWIGGPKSGEDLVLGLVRSVPFSPEVGRDLLEMKGRIENERVGVGQQQRDIKLGEGGLNDLEWIVRLGEMKHQLAGGGLTEDRTRSLIESGWISAAESAFMIDARNQWLTLRLQLHLLGIKDDLIPEDPAKLAVLVRLAGAATDHEFWSQHLATRKAVRALYQDKIQNLSN